MGKPADFLSWPMEPIGLMTFKDHHYSGAPFLHIMERLLGHHGVAMFGGLVPMPGKSGNCLKDRKYAAIKSAHAGTPIEIGTVRALSQWA